MNNVLRILVVGHGVVLRGKPMVVPVVFGLRLHFTVKMSDEMPLADMIRVLRNERREYCVSSPMFQFVFPRLGVNSVKNRVVFRG